MPRSYTPVLSASLVVVCIGVVGWQLTGSLPGSGLQAPDPAILVQAARDADQANLDLVAVPLSARDHFVRLPGVQNPVPDVSLQAMRDLAAAGRTNIARYFTGREATIQAESLSVCDLAVPHEPERAGDPVSIIALGGGVLSFDATSVTSHGSSARVVARTVGWSDSIAYFATGKPDEARPRSPSIDTITLQRGRDGRWRASMIEISYAVEP